MSWFSLFLYIILHYLAEKIKPLCKKRRFYIWSNGISYVSDAANTYSPNKEHLLPATYTACTKQTTNSTTKLKLSFTAQNVQETLAITRTKQTTNTYKHSSNSRPLAGCCCVLFLLLFSLSFLLFYATLYTFTSPF